MNRWTVHVSDFGKIEYAHIQLAPLTLFVGDNNSGKSYMMTLIYGVFKINFLLEEYVFNSESLTYKECCEIVDKMIDNLLKTNKEITYILKEEELQKFQNLLNEVLD